MPSNIEDALATLRSGGVICHACEGVWGFACDPFEENAVLRILSIKQRSISKGLIVIGACADVFQEELDSLPFEQQTSIQQSWPGHTTWVVPNRRFPPWVTGNFDTIAVRVPDHAQSRELASRFLGPLVSTSANTSGEAELTTYGSVLQEFGNTVDCVLEGRIGKVHGPSKIYDALTGERIR